jgi:hypothetical protein
MFHNWNDDLKIKCLIKKWRIYGVYSLKKVRRVGGGGKVENK